MNKERRGIYNVSFNEKNSTPINAELEAIENAIIDYVVHYVKGWHNERRDKGRGAEHIRLHLEKGSEGEISLEELLNLGNSIREYLKIFKEPYKDSNDARVYEWENNESVRFRIVTDTNYKLIKGEGHSNTPLSPSDEIIITFYSDGNLNKQMEFKNPKVAKYYANQTKNFKSKLTEFNTKNNANKTIKNKDLEK
ncbi:hypothetical protein FTH69_05435 [Campylobacter upsaliensis]|nr:hypothetical protein [Campylobacter upsaliensis]